MPPGKGLSENLPPNGTKAVTDETTHVAARAHASDRDMITPVGWLSPSMLELRARGGTELVVLSTEYFFSTSWNSN